MPAACSEVPRDSHTSDQLATNWGVPIINYLAGNDSKKSEKCSTYDDYFILKDTNLDQPNENTCKAG